MSSVQLPNISAIHEYRTKIFNMGLMEFKSESPLQKQVVDGNSQRVTYLWLERLDQTFLSVKRLKSNNSYNPFLSDVSLQKNGFLDLVRCVWYIGICVLVIIVYSRAYTSY